MGKQVTKCRGSRAYREFRNSMRKKSHASNQGDIRQWAKSTPSSPQEKNSQQDDKTNLPKPQQEKEKEVDKAKSPATSKKKCPTNASIMPKLKSVVHRVNTAQR